VVKFPDPDPAKRSVSDRIRFRIRIRNTGQLALSSFKRIDLVMGVFAKVCWMVRKKLYRNSVTQVKS
jgi:hypothetical protein